MAFIKKILVLHFILSFTVVEGQDTYFNHYTEFSGLPGSIVYKSIQDHKGFLWFATNKGISRFDGEEFINFTVKDGLPDNDILGLYEDSKGRIWLETFDGSVGYYFDGKFYTSSNETTLNKISLSDYIKTTFEDSNGNIWMGTRNEIVCINLEKKQVDKFENMQSQYFWETENGLLSFPGTHETYNHSLKKSIKQNINLDSIPPYISERMFQLNDGSLLVAKYNKLYTISNNGSILIELKKINEIQKAEILSLKEINGTILIGTRNGFLEVDNFRNPDSLIAYQLKNYEINSINVDHENHIWITTNDGIFQYFSNRITRLEMHESAIGTFNCENNKLVVGYKDKKIQLFVRESNIDKWKLKNEITLNSVPKEIKFKGNEILISSEVGLYSYNPDDQSGYIFNFAVKGFFIKEDTIIVGSSGGLFKFAYKNYKNFDPTILNKRKKIISGRIFGLSENSSDKSYYISSKKGCYELNGSLKKIDFLEPIIKYKILHIHSLRDTLYISTQNNGLYIFIGKKIKQHFNSSNGLKSDWVIQSFIYNKDLYIITEKGISIFKNNKLIIIPETVSKSFSLTIAQIIDHTILIGTTNGLMMINLNESENIHTNPKIDVNVFLNGTKEIIPDYTLLDYDQNSLNFNFDRITFGNHEYKYKYRILGLDEKWQTTLDENVNYKNLPPGEYVFELEYAEGKIYRYHFEITKPFWKETWFYILTIAVFIIFMILFYKYLLKRMKRKSEVVFKFKLALAEAEQKALRAQLNPHFIFNSLNAIQNLILKSDIDNAYKYLGEFGKLMRITIKNSRDAKNTLEEEIQFLKLYLSIESLRFDGTFNVSFIVGTEVNLNRMIPSLILQPFVENALLHGLLPLGQDKEKILEIKFEETNDFLICLIKDNGVGYDFKKEKNSNKTKNDSYGQELSINRLKLFDPTGESTIQIHSKDNNPNWKEGTEIELKIKKND